MGEEGSQEQGEFYVANQTKIEEKVPLEIAIKIQIQKRTHPFLTIGKYSYQRRKRIYFFIETSLK